MRRAARVVAAVSGIAVLSACSGPIPQDELEEILEDAYDTDFSCEEDLVREDEAEVQCEVIDDDSWEFVLGEPTMFWRNDGVWVRTNLHESQYTFPRDH